MRLTPFLPCNRLPLRQSMNAALRLSATIRQLFLTLTSTLWVVGLAIPAVADETYPLPQFRQVLPPLTLPQVESSGPFRLLADADFPPFSFASQQGAPAGLAVELALAACGEAKIECEVQLLPYAELLPALASRAGDAVISGPALDETSLACGSRPGPISARWRGLPCKAAARWQKPARPLWPASE